MEYLKKSKKWLIYFIIIVFLIGCFVFYNYYVYHLDLKNNVFTYEYGEKVNLKLENYLVADTHKDILENAKLDSNIQNEKGKEYPQIGEYKATIKYKKNKIQFTIKVLDTKKPEWKTHPSTLYIEQNAEDVKLEDYFEANDLNKVRIKIEDSDLNINKIGQYKAKVVAEDEYKNRNEHEVTVHVVTFNDSTKKKMSQTIKGKVPESKKARREREIQKSKKKMISAGNRPKDSTLVNKPASNVPSGRTICLNKPTGYTPPSTLPRGDLTDEEFAILDSFYDDYVVPLKQTNFTITLSYTYTKESIVNAMNYLNNFLGSNISYKITQDKGEKQKLKVKVFFYDFVSQHLNQERKDLAYEACIKAGLKNGMSERSAVKKINDWIIEHMTYKKNNGDADVGFKTGKGQCHTYAQMFDEMCEVVNISCTYERGYADGVGGWGSHAWNRVKIGSSWYYIDTTWNDSNPKNRYYLSTTLWSNHKIG